MKGFGNLPGSRGQCINTNCTRGCQPRSLAMAAAAMVAIVAMDSDYLAGKRL
jgi:hypothetical protein